MRIKFLLSPALVLSLLIPVSVLAGPPDGRRVNVNSRVRTTSFGIPHIDGPNWASLGYGLGYAYARDNLCILAREIVTARGEEAKYFGPSSGNLSRSFLYKLTSRESELERLFAIQPRPLQDMVHAYAAGYNRYLSETGVDDLPSACAGQPWVRPITAGDLSAVFAKGNTRASVSPLRNAIVNAAPPISTPSPARFSLSFSNAATPSPALDLSGIQRLLNINREFDGGSNAYGLGSNVTENGRGMLLGNPHEPWDGISRFYEAHLTLPGRLNVMGVTQIALPVIVIGFNEDVAWSHTISTAKRFTIYELTLDPADPLAYFVTDESGGVTRHEITPVTVSIEVAGEAPRQHTFYRSHHGWMIDLKTLAGAVAPGWGDDARPLGGPQSVAYTIRDVNEDNIRGLEQWWQMDRARSVPDLLDKIETTLGLPFVNTIAADRDGNALYADVGTVPHVTEEKFASCTGSIVTILINQFGVPALDGSRDACEWGNDPGTPQDGVLGPENLPSLVTPDYVTNSNDSYWLSNPDQRLEGFSPMLRRDMFNEQGPRILRTRMGLIQVLDRLSNRDGLGGTKFDLPKLQQIFYSNRNYSAELELDAVVADCQSGSIPQAAWPTSSGGTVDVTQACALLAQWSRRDDIDSVGVPVWRQFFDRLGRDVAKFSVPFDVNDPINTPRTLAINATIREALGDAVEQLNNLGIPLDAPLGEVQFVTSDGQPLAADGSNRIPMHGGRGQNGVFNVAQGPLGPQGWTPITSGPTYMQTVTWDDKGDVVAEALLGFSLSDDPENPHYSDQTRRYSEKDFIRLPFTNAEIQADLKSSVRLIDHLRIPDDLGAVVQEGPRPGQAKRPRLDLRLR